jgi:hypothetical protein
MKKRIKNELLKKPLDEWNKESIIFLTYIYKYPKYSEFYDNNLLLLDNYIKWYKIKDNNDMVKDNMYNIDKLIKLYIMIKEDMYYDKNYNYTYFLNDYDNSNNSDNKNISIISLLYDFYYYLFNEKFCSLSFGLMLTIIYAITKFLYNLLFLCKKEEEKKIFEFKIPIPNNILDNPFIKQLLNDKFLI